VDDLAPFDTLSDPSRADLTNSVLSIPEPCTRLAVDEFAVVSGPALSTIRRLIRLVVSESKFREDTRRGRLTARDAFFSVSWRKWFGLSSLRTFSKFDVS
jgi:hypothetical protein